MRTRKKDRLIQRMKHEKASELLQIRIQPSLKTQLQEFAEDHGVSVAKVVTEAIRMALE